MLRYGSGLLGLVLATSYHDLLDWISEHLLSCPFKKLFLIDCPGCGLQRSVIALLHGNIRASWMLYPPTTPLLVLLGFVFLHMRFEFKYGTQIIKVLYGIIILLIVINYILKIKNHQLL